jgi:hypothetical protein
MPNRIVNFQMQQPGEMQQLQAVGNQQQKRQSLAGRLKRYGVGQDSGEGVSNAFDQQLRNSMLMREPQTPQQQQAGQIMKGYNAPGGGSEMGWKPSAPMSAQRGMMGAAARTGGAISRGASNAGGAISRGFGSDVGGFGKLFA